MKKGVKVRESELTELRRRLEILERMVMFLSESRMMKNPNLSEDSQTNPNPFGYSQTFPPPSPEI
jgi:hypothetical protein